MPYRIISEEARYNEKLTNEDPETTYDALLRSIVKCDRGQGNIFVLECRQCVYRRGHGGIGEEGAREWYRVPNWRPNGLLD